jgi:hypothetical protein
MVTYTNPARTCEHILPAGLIRVNARKLRKLSQAKIARYRADYEAGDDFPPITVLNCGGFYTVRDGRHRYQAQLACGFVSMAVLVLN